MNQRCSEIMKTFKIPMHNWYFTHFHDFIACLIYISLNKSKEKLSIETAAKLIFVLVDIFDFNKLLKMCYMNFNIILKSVWYYQYLNCRANSEG